MFRHRFPQPVCIRAAHLGNVVQILFSAQDALVSFGHRWPGRLSAKARDAVYVCERVMVGQMIAEQAYRFVRDALAAKGTLIAHPNRPAGLPWTKPVSERTPS